jgi:hypothetical protein
VIRTYCQYQDADPLPDPHHLGILDPDPHLQQGDKPDPDSDPHQIKIRIRIRIKVISQIRIRIRIKVMRIHIIVSQYINLSKKFIVKSIKSGSASALNKNQDPDPHPDPHPDLHPHQSHKLDADPQHRLLLALWVTRFRLGIITPRKQLMKRGAH